VLGTDALEEPLAAAAAALAALRAHYAGGASRYPYGCQATQLAYCAGYVPHYAQQFERALARQGIAPGVDQIDTMVCIGAGPGTEALGLAYTISECAGELAPSTRHVTLVDFPGNDWALGRALIRHELAWQQHAGSVGVMNVDAQHWNFLDGGSLPVPVRAALGSARLVTIANVMTEVVTLGRLARQRFERAVNSVFSAMSPGATLLLTDMAGYTAVLDYITVLASSLRAAGATVPPPQLDYFRSEFATVDCPVLRRRLFSDDPSSYRRPRSRVRGVSLAARKS
jgi:hypothetical protein